MSRVGKKFVLLPKGVDVEIYPSYVDVMGPKGQLRLVVPSEVEIRKESQSLHVTLRPSCQNSAIWGTVRAKLASLVGGVSQGYERVLELHGVGYRVTNKKDNILEMTLGFSHPVQFVLPKGIDAKLEKDTVIILTGVDKELLGQVAARIRALRVPDVYQNKGIRYRGEKLRKKVGKSGTAAKG